MENNRLKLNKQFIYNNNAYKMAITLIKDKDENELRIELRERKLQNLNYDIIDSCIKDFEIDDLELKKENWDKIKKALIKHLEKENSPLILNILNNGKEVKGMVWCEKNDDNQLVWKWFSDEYLTILKKLKEIDLDYEYDELESKLSNLDDYNCEIKGLKTIDDMDEWMDGMESLINSIETLCGDMSGVIRDIENVRDELVEELENE